MKTPEPSDDELNRLLASRLKRTSPEFEQRWRELRASFTRPAPRRWLPWTRVLGWPGLATAALAALTVVVVLRSPRPGPANPGPADFEELFALDAALAPALPLLEAENREAVLHLSPSTNLQQPIP